MAHGAAARDRYTGLTAIIGSVSGASGLCTISHLAGHGQVLLPVRVPRREREGGRLWIFMSSSTPAHWLVVRETKKTSIS